MTRNIKVDTDFYNLLEMKDKKYPKIEQYIEENFSYYTKYNNFWIVATNDKPKFSLYDKNAEDIFDAIVNWVKLLLIKKDDSNYSSLQFYNLLSNNYILAYGNYNYLKKKYN